MGRPVTRDSSLAPVDSPAEVRPGEALDLCVLQAFISAELPDFTGPLTLRQFPAGFSNLTYLLQSGDNQLVLRRPPFGTKAKTAHDMGREYRVLSALHPVFPYCPQPLCYCDDDAVIGSPFYLMEYRRGIIIRNDYPAELQLSPGQVRAQYLALIDVMAELHQLDFAAAGLADLGRPEGYAQRQIAGWSKRFRAARTEDVPDFEATMAWLAEHLPPGSGRAGIIHNDFKLDNVIWDAGDPQRLVGVLDWEMATLGDPLMDFGCTLGYWVEAGDPDAFRAMRPMPTDIPGAPTRAEIAAHYAERTGIAVADLDYYFCFGLFRLAVIAQQIYYRYFHGQTQDPRFAGLGRRIEVLDRMCQMVRDSKRAGRPFTRVR